MIMDEKYIQTALTKLYNSLLFKDRIDFKVEVMTILIRDDVFYKIIVKVIVDHAKFWSDSPEYSRDYNNLINEISDDYSDELVEITKYFLPTEHYDVWVKYEHYNTDAYEPLLKELGTMGVAYVTEFSEHTCSFKIILDAENERPNIVSSLNSDIDDIIMYYGDIT
jgi:hypothetical protein